MQRAKPLRSAAVDPPSGRSITRDREVRIVLSTEGHERFLEPGSGIAGDDDGNDRGDIAGAGRGIGCDRGVRCH